MKKAWLEACQLAAAIVLCTGCHVLPALPPVVQDMGPRYRPTNIYRQSPLLPPQLRRVALLPLTTTESTAFLQAGVETLTPVVYAELEKCKRFEIIAVSPDQLRQLTGKPGWRTDEPLPPDFFSRLSDATGCDAVLFCQLTRYQPYQPLAMGWKFALVANPPPGPAPAGNLKDTILWSADEVVDAGEPGVANAARDYYAQHLHNETPSADVSTILSSPVRFGQYTLAALLETLPYRFVAAH
ncbi:MAG TPA: hypothetical protein VFC44_12440 [Candidatus Saccharimonadales bacterium]|nr:hypothetical protein [Candidatus Saccharimonadales bacterium]